MFLGESVAGRGLHGGRMQKLAAMGSDDSLWGPGIGPATWQMCPVGAGAPTRRWRASTLALFRRGLAGWISLKGTHQIPVGELVRVRASASCNDLILFVRICQKLD